MSSLSPSWDAMVQSGRPDLVFHVISERYPTEDPENFGTISPSIPKREGHYVIGVDWSEKGFVWVSFRVDGPSPLDREG